MPRCHFSLGIRKEPVSERHKADMLRYVKEEAAAALWNTLLKRCQQVNCCRKKYNACQIFNYMSISPTKKCN